MALRIAELLKKGKTIPAGAPARDDLLRQAPHVRTARRGEETALLDLRGERYYSLNEAGTLAWGLLAPGATKREIVEAIRREYELPAGGPDAVEADVARLLHDLLAAGLVVAAQPRRPGDRR